MILLKYHACPITKPLPIVPNRIVTDSGKLKALRYDKSLRSRFNCWFGLYLRQVFPEDLGEHLSGLIFKGTFFTDAFPENPITPPLIDEYDRYKNSGNDRHDLQGIR